MNEHFPPALGDSAGADDSRLRASAQRAVPHSAYPIKWHGDVNQAPLKEWLVHELLPKVGKGIVAGQWGTYKTFIVLDLARAVITKSPFAGRAVNRQGGVLFIAAEGQNEVLVRLEAIAREKVAALDNRSGDAAPVDPARMPFAWIESCPRLTADDALEKLREIVNAARRGMRERFNLPLALIVIDTLMPAAGFKDANDASETQRVMTVLATVALEAECLVLAVDHFGKDVNTGTRNSSNKEDNADAVLALLAERATNGAISNPRLAIRKLRGGPTGEEIAFAVREVTVYENASSEAVKTLVIEWADQAPAQSAAEPAKAKRWPKSLSIFKKALDYALASSGKRMHPFTDGPEVQAVEREAVRTEFLRAYPADNAKAKGMAFGRCVRAALAEGLMNARELGEGETAATYFWSLSPP